MAAAASLFPMQRPSSSEEPRIVIEGVPWATYVVLRDSVHSPATRMTYLEGCLEIMRTSREHEVEKTAIARLLELFCLERDIPLFGYGSTTFRKEERERGLEPAASVFARSGPSRSAVSASSRSAPRATSRSRRARSFPRSTSVESPTTCRTRISTARSAPSVTSSGAARRGDGNEAAAALLVRIGLVVAGLRGAAKVDYGPGP